jgi:hypothetical protein
MAHLVALPDRYGRVLSRLLQIAISYIFVFGVWSGNLSVVVNGGLALAVTFLPALMERDYRISMNPWLIAFITGTLLLHTLGMVGLYNGVWWFDHLTHTLSASIVAGVSYAIVRAVEEYSEAVTLTPGFLFVFTLIVTLALGVLWEILEFSMRHLAQSTDLTPVLIQYGLSDTLGDLLFNLIGALLIAIFGTGIYDDIAKKITSRLEEYTPHRPDTRSARTSSDAAEPDQLATMVYATHRNASIAWLLVGALMLLIVQAAKTGAGVHAVLVGTVAVLALIPPLVYGSSRVMLPWGVLALAAVPGVIYELAGAGQVSEFAAYITVAAVALVVAVEIHIFTSVDMSPRFAVAFVVLTTMAVSGVWALARWASDLWLGTSFLLRAGPPGTVETKLMWGFIYSTTAGLLAGVVFERVFLRRANKTALYGEQSHPPRTQ